ncbi:hypothetical protein PISL3812_01315 [Talaromyces islandicus]|uniref:Uncharacterized protein n=1 Tax=Talaromyces islandicus TaxID=28573 RepID=A0A0U1LLT6_TALIS|nr:hypothetical protein PISL3812_01315 [Talaromyces islandicus]
MTSTIILIPGAKAGIGFAASKALSCSSPSYYIMIGGSEEKLTAAMNEISALPGLKGTLSIKRLDVTDGESIKAIVDYVEQQFSHLDVLINNARVGGLNANTRESFMPCSFCTA